MNPIHIPCSQQFLEWEDVIVYARNFLSLISPEMDAFVDGQLTRNWYVWLSVDYRDGGSNPVLLPMGIKESDWSPIQQQWLMKFLRPQE
jgi:hypothetical protein